MGLYEECAVSKTKEGGDRSDFLAKNNHIFTTKTVLAY